MKIEFLKLIDCYNRVYYETFITRKRRVKAEIIEEFNFEDSSNKLYSIVYGTYEDKHRIYFISLEAAKIYIKNKYTHKR